MLHSSAVAISCQARLSAPRAHRQGAARPRRTVACLQAGGAQAGRGAESKKQTVWNGEGPDYTMKDVERFAEQEAARRFHLPAEEGQWDGEGKDYDMRDVERLHAQLAAKVAAQGGAQEQTVWNGEGSDFDMKEVERLHDELAAKVAAQADEEARK